jgi:hypothetical protein
MNLCHYAEARRSGFDPARHAPRPADFNQLALASILKFSEQIFIAMEKPA